MTSDGCDSRSSHLLRVMDLRLGDTIEIEGNTATVVSIDADTIMVRFEDGKMRSISWNSIET